jgi:hypothetical protein
MSKRLQVILDEDELRAIQDIAKQHRTTVAEWVRQALRAARRRAAVRHQFPTGDIRQMLAEIESGYLQDDRV